MCKKMFALRTETNDTYEKDDLSENNGSSGNDDFLCIVEEEEQNNNLEVWGNFGGKVLLFPRTDYLFIGQEIHISWSFA